MEHYEHMKFFTALFLFFPLTLFAVEIKEPLFCSVQEFENISIPTNTTKSIEYKKIEPTNPIKVIYIPLKNGVKEIYGKGSNTEITSTLEKGYSAGGTQYLNIKNTNHVVTYFGKNNDGYHTIMKYQRIQRNNGSAKTGFRSDSYLNIFMYCADKEKLNTANK